MRELMNSHHNSSTILRSREAELPDDQPLHFVLKLHTLQRGLKYIKQTNIILTKQLNRADSTHTGSVKLKTVVNMILFCLKIRAATQKHTCLPSILDAGALGM
eukprot:TRINITY_DN33784_c0_g1_i1.p1 TRINITY_DN33784_c0_g1~~TRINITY_DN33784_c0_g1_i1.p1  ORF type:complete len:118 (-),score=6.30 TRINITY_DN33784_c0_g1_i1:54-362(-)